MYVQDAELYTSAGVTAGIDLSLYLLGRDHGPEVALSVAKRLVVFTQRSGGQSQFSPFLTPHAEPTSAVALVQLYVLANLNGDLTLADLANAANMSARNFSRVFAREAKVTPAEFVERARWMRRGCCWKARVRRSRPWRTSAGFAMPSTCAACSTAGWG